MQRPWRPLGNERESNLICEYFGIDFPFFLLAFLCKEDDKTLLELHCSSKMSLPFVLLLIYPKRSAEEAPRMRNDTHGFPGCPKTFCVLNMSLVVLWQHVNAKKMLARLYLARPFKVNAGQYCVCLDLGCWRAWFFVYTTSRPDNMVSCRQGESRILLGSR